MKKVQNKIYPNLVRIANVCKYLHNFYYYQLLFKTTRILNFYVTQIITIIKYRNG
jgi:hypothetical protein